MSWKYANTNDYLKLVRRFPLAPISSREQHAEAIATIRALALKDGMTGAESDYFDVLSRLIQDYERQIIASVAVSPQAALKFLMEHNDFTQIEIATIAGVQKSHISEFLGGKRGISRQAAARLGARFKVDPMLFLPKVKPAVSSAKVIVLKQAKNSPL